MKIMKGVHLIIIKRNMKVLNLYAGIGGNRKLWKNVNVTMLENNKEIADVYKRFYPLDKVIIGDAMDYLMDNFDKFDFIWASPPCQTHSKMRYLASKRGDYKPKLPNLHLYSLILFLQHFAKHKKWVVENVNPYYKTLIEPTIKLDRHLFWSNFGIGKNKFEKPEVKHKKVTGKTIRYGFDLTGIKLKHRKDQLIRNMVNPEVALHIFDCAFNKGSLNVG